MQTDQPGKTSSAPCDADLISAARRGGMDEFRILVGRHQDAGLRLARRLAPAAPTELLAEAVSGVSTGLRSGTGPKVAFRTHLLTAVKRTAAANKPARTRPEEGGAICGIDPTMHAAATRAYRALPESQQVALWNTEVDGDPLLDTGRLLGVSGTEIAELAFAGREAVRQALMAPHMETVTAGPCRWTVDRLGAHVRGRLTPANNEKVTAHLQTCAPCAAVLPPVRTVETELQVLIATVVLGTTAAAYLGLEIPAQAKRGPMAALVGGPAYLLRHGKAAAFVGLGAVVLTGGLVGGLNMVASSTPAAATGTFSIRPGTSDPTPPVDTVADSGSGVTGGTASAADPAKVVPTAVPTARPEMHSAGASATAAQPAAPIAPTTAPATPAPKKDSAPTLHLGFTDLSITPGHGLLWLLSFGDPND